MERVVSMKVSEYFEEGGEWPQIGIGDSLWRQNPCGEEKYYLVVQSTGGCCALINKETGNRCKDATYISDVRAIKRYEMRAMCGEHPEQFYFVNTQLFPGEPKPLPFGTKLLSHASGDKFLSTDTGFYSLRTGLLTNVLPHGQLTLAWHKQHTWAGDFWEIVEMGMGA